MEHKLIQQMIVVRSPVQVAQYINKFDMPYHKARRCDLITTQQDDMMLIRYENVTCYEVING